MRRHGSIGLVVPPAHGRVPPDAQALYPTVEFCASGLAVNDMAVGDFHHGLARLDAAVNELLDRGASALSLMGTSISFFRGPTAHEELLERMKGLSNGRPVSTMSAALVRALRHLRVRRVVVLSAYTELMASRLETFLDHSGIGVVESDRLEISEIAQLRRVDTDVLVARSDALLGRSPAAEAVVISCGGLDTLDAIVQLEKRHHIPVISSSQAGLWDIVNLTGWGATSPHPSRLLVSR